MPTSLPCIFNDLDTSIHNSTTCHIADDTNVLHIVDYSKQRNKKPLQKHNLDLKSLNQWLIANKISLNATKTELIYFRYSRTPIPSTALRSNGV